MRTHFIHDRNEIDAILKQCKTCYVAMSDNDVPYVLPLNFAMDGDKVILHSAPHGRMWETIKKNPKVCINWTLGEDVSNQNLLWWKEQPNLLRILRKRSELLNSL